MNIFKLGKRTAVTGILFLVSLSVSFGQQDAQFSQNVFNPFYNNPGVAGSDNEVNIVGFIREQWMGFEGHPKTNLFTLHAPVKPFGIPSGVGLTFMDDQLGFEKNINIHLSYAYQAQIGSGSLGIGLSLGLLNKTLEGDWKIPDSDFHSSISSDPAIPSGKVSGMAFDMGFGLYYKLDRFSAGLSTSHILEPEIYLGATSKADIHRHYYLSTSYSFQLANPLFEIKPYILLKTDGASSQFYLNTNVLYNKKFWGGVSYRLGDAIIVMAGMVLQNGFKAGIAYDFTTSPIGAYSNGSVEFMVGYSLSLGMDKGTKKYKSVRLL